MLERADPERFRVEAAIGNAARDRFEQVRAWVEPGVLYNEFPRDLLERLGHRADATRKFQRAGGAVVELPVADVPIRIGAEVVPVLAIFSEGDEMLLGRLTLSAFCLEPDYENQRLTPGVALLVSPREVP